MIGSRRLWLLLLLALALRIVLQGWDSGLLSPHPDERQVAFVAERMSSWFGDPDFYAYGSLHFQMVRAATRLLGLPASYGGLLKGGRVLSLVTSMLVLLLAWRLAHRAWGRRSGELVLLLGALLPLHLQLSHYATVEAHHAAWVMLCLGACWSLAMRPTVSSALLAGAAAGASLAVKVSSLPLAAPLFFALLVVSSRLGWRQAAMLGTATTAAVAATFALCQPSALAAAWPPFSSAYLRGVAEQVAMVTGASDLPYVRIYHGTWRVLYPARELALWGFGPGLFLAAVGGGLVAVLLAVRRLRTRLFRHWSPSLILLGVIGSWIVPMAFRLATLEVKFLRYWEPLALPLVMVVAWWVPRLPRRWRRPATATVVASTVVAGIAYMWGFVAPHPHATAGEWLSTMLEPGQVVAVEHWDETLRLQVPGGGVRTTTLPSYDLPDSAPKLRRWCQALSGADWVVFSSHRIRRTVFANRDRYPHTARLYELLLSGEAGFEVLSQAQRGPGILGLRWPVQRADESFVNYDFPRVTLLRRTAEVPVADLVDQAMRAQSEDLPSLRELEARFIDPAPELPSSHGAGRQLIDLGVWMLVFLAAGAALWAMLAPVLHSCPDGGISLALCAGWILPAWSLWMLSELGLARVGPSSASMLYLAVIAVGGLAAWRRRHRLLALWRRRRSGIRLVLACATAVFALFLLARLYNPAIGWGEKPMDFAFLNAFVNAHQWPPGEPWMAGKSLNYYYFGQILAAFPILLTGCSAAVGYNLVAATVPAMAAAMLAAIGVGLARRRWHGLLLPLLVLLTGNLAWPFLLDLAHDRRWFDMWWATSRVIPGFAIEEYPLWTALFADLHGHFVALPLLVAALWWAWRMVELGDRRWWVAAAATALTVAALAATNPWDLLLFATTVGVATVVAARRPLAGLGRLAAAAVLSLLAAWPFILELGAWLRASSGGSSIFLNGVEFAPAWAIARHFGLFLGPLTVLALIVARRDLLIATPLAGAGVWVGLALRSSAMAMALGLAALFFTVVIGRRLGRLERLQWSLALLAVLAVAFCERVTIMDRMNTIFKIYNGAWLLLATALAVAVLRQRGWRRRVVVACWAPLQLVALVNLPLGIAQGWVQPRVASPRPTLDGQAFLAVDDPQTAFLVRALKGIARPGDVVAEAAGDPYREFTRLAMHTGQSTVVGWEHHLFQRGQSRQEIHRRFDDLVSLYVLEDPLQRRAILDLYGVRWVAMAGVERRAYRVPGDAALDTIPGVRRFAGRHGAVLFEVLR